MPSVLFLLQFTFFFPFQNITRRCTPVSSPSSTCEAQFLQNPTGAQTILRVSSDSAISHSTLCFHLRLTPHGHPESPSLTLTSTYMPHPPPITQNESLSDNVQITPQAVSLRVRPGETGRNEWTPQFVSPYTQFFERRRCTTLLAIHISRVSLWSVLYAHTHICTYVHGNVVQSRCPPYSQCTHPSLCFYVCSYCIVKQGCITAYL